MNQNFDDHSFRDFEYIPGMDAWARARMFQAYLDDQTTKGQLNYRLVTTTGCGPVVEINGSKLISLVSNDYLGFTQHPAVKRAAMDGIAKYGSGAGASPAIGGHYDYHALLEKKIAGFFRKKHAIIYTTGYNSNSDSLGAILTKDDQVILDAGVHTSVMQGCQPFNRKTVKHNDLDAYEHALKLSKGKHPLVLVIIDGVYSQDGDLAPLKEIIALCKKYGAKLMVDDAHGTGVYGHSGSGIIEHFGLFGRVHIQMGTLSKAVGASGAFIAGSKTLIEFLRNKARSFMFSTALPPADVASACKALELIQSEPERRIQLKSNSAQMRSGLADLGLPILPGDTIVVPPKIEKGAILRELVDISTILQGFGIGAAAIEVLK